MSRGPRRPMTDEQRINRRMYNMQPEVRYKKSVKRAIKHHLTPPAISYKVSNIPGSR